MVKRKKNNLSKYLILGLAIAVLISGSGYLIYKKNHKNTAGIAKDKTTSTAPSAQENFDKGGARSVATTPENKGSAGVSDSQGQQVSVADNSQWSTSKTGEITVYSPMKDKLLINGDLVSGESTLPIVYYRVLDDVTGMIAQGQLIVVGGKFSGSINYTTSASNGRLDIYGASDSGREFGNVEIPVRFK